MFNVIQKHRCTTDLCCKFVPQSCKVNDTHYFLAESQFQFSNAVEVLCTYFQIIRAEVLWEAIKNWKNLPYSFNIAKQNRQFEGDFWLQDPYKLKMGHFYQSAKICYTLLEMSYIVYRMNCYGNFDNSSCQYWKLTNLKVESAKIEYCQN